EGQVAAGARRRRVRIRSPDGGAGSRAPARAADAPISPVAEAATRTARVDRDTGGSDVTCLRRAARSGTPGSEFAGEGRIHRPTTDDRSCTAQGQRADRPRW